MHLERLKIFPIETWEVDPNSYISRLVYQLEKVEELKGNVFIRIVYLLLKQALFPGILKL